MNKKPFVTKEQLDEITAKFPTPYHLYDEKGIRDNAKAVKEAFAWNKGYREYFAVKACPNPTLIQIMKEYGFEEIEKEVKKICNLGEMIARENIEKGHSMGIEQGQKLERITLIKNMTESLQCSMQRAMDVLKLTAGERKDVEEYFKS